MPYIRAAFRLLFRCTVGVVSLLFVPAPASADLLYGEGKFATFASVPSGGAPIRDYPHIEITRRITTADLNKLPELIKRFRSNRNYKLAENPIVVLNSTGGDLTSAMAIGRLLRRENASVWLTGNDECSSACVFVLASGSERFVSVLGRRVGLHRPYFPPALFAGLSFAKAEALYSSMIENCRTYLREMGMKEMLLDDMLHVPSQEVTYVDESYLRNVGLVGKDPAFEEWLRARSIKRLGENKVKQRDLIYRCLQEGHTPLECERRFGPYH